MRGKEFIYDRSGYEDLANAIVIVAVRDYRSACRRYSRGDDKALEKIKEVERFFNSKWGNVCCCGKAKEILLRLKAEQGANEVIKRMANLKKQQEEGQCLSCKYFILCNLEKQAYYKITGNKCDGYRRKDDDDKQKVRTHQKG